MNISATVAETEEQSLGQGFQQRSHQTNLEGGVGACLLVAPLLWSWWLRGTPGAGLVGRPLLLWLELMEPDRLRSLSEVTEPINPISELKLILSPFYRSFYFFFVHFPFKITNGVFSHGAQTQEKYETKLNKTINI